MSVEEMNGFGCLIMHADGEKGIYLLCACCVSGIVQCWHADSFDTLLLFIDGDTEPSSIHGLACLRSESQGVAELGSYLDLSLCLTLVPHGRVSQFPLHCLFSY